MTGDVISFGGLHPDSANYREELKTLKNMGFQGIKLHPAYQETMFHDIRYKRIVSYASELGLIITVHGGYDPGYPDCVYCTPQMAAEVIDEVQPEKLVIAHMGGLNAGTMWSAASSEKRFIWIPPLYLVQSMTDSLCAFAGTTVQIVFSLPQILHGPGRQSP